jgi:hypothetical protein
METKKKIVENWLPRYTGVPLKNFGRYILLTNFDRYVELFANWHRVPVHGQDKPMPSATAHGITIINFGMGSATAATVMDLLSAIHPEAVLFLGKCGGLKHRAKLGEPHPPHRRDPRRRHEQRLFPSRGARPAPRSPCRRPSPPPSATTSRTTGPAPFTRPTAASGSTTTEFKKYLKKVRAMASTWRPPPSS